MVLTHVIVDEEPVGKASFACAHADIFRAGELTVSFVDPPIVARVFRPGSWARARVVDENLYPLYTLEAPAEARS